MNIGITQDMKLVREMAAKVWDRMSEDDVSIDEFTPYNAPTTLWLVCTDNNENIGIILVHNDNSTTIEFHPYIMPDHKGKGFSMINAFFQWFLDNIHERVNKINVKVPFMDKSVYNFSKKLGFIDEGIDRQSYTKNGTIYDRWILGMTRKDIREI